MSFIKYLRDVRAEFVHISWPTPKQAMLYTVLVIIISVATSLYLGALDLGLANLLERII